MTRSELVKVRMSPRTKSALFRIAERFDTTVSALIRDLVHQLTTGRSPDREARADMATVRLLANIVLDRAADDPLLLEAGARLRDLSARHLRPAT